MKIGITERGDAMLNLEWIQKLPSVDFAVVITKGLGRINESFRKALFENQKKIILHVTCTGYGGTSLEPNVPSVEKTVDVVKNLTSTHCFPARQIVLRVDPIIPTPKGILKTKHVLDAFSETGIERVRYSFIDMYPHVVERFVREGMFNPYQGSNFLPTEEMVQATLKMFGEYPNYQFEACAENTPHQLGCISQKDLSALGIQEDLGGSANQRKGCLCPSGKTELLSNRGRCGHKCLYCYWK